jgi:urease accessory protein UreH
MPGLDLGTPTGTMLRTPELPRRSGSRTEAAASAWNGMLVARILAPNGAALRRTVIAALSVLRESRPLPRVWMC